MTEEELRMHIKRLENIKIRYERGDGLYGRATVGTLLTEIEILSERCLDKPKEPPSHDWLEQKSVREHWAPVDGDQS